MAFLKGINRRTSLATFSLLGCAAAAVAAAGACANATNNPGGNGSSSSSGSSSGSGNSSGGGGSSGGGNSSGGNTSSGASSSSGAGGSSGSSGSSGGGSSSGSGGSTANDGGTASDAQVALCASKATIPSTNPVLINFETYTGMTTAANFGVGFGGPTPGTSPTPAGPYAGPYAYAGPDGGTDGVLSMVAGRSGGTLEGGATDWALDLSVMPETQWGTAMGIWMGCANARAFKGISFWMRGQVPTNMVSVQLQTADTSPTPGGTCSGTCTPATASSLGADAGIPVTLNWTQIQLPWALFTGGIASGAAYTPTGDNITGLQFTIGSVYAAVDAAADGAAIYGPIPGNIDLQLDDIQFMP